MTPTAQALTPEFIITQVRLAGDAGLTPHQFRAQHSGAAGVSLAELDSLFRAAIDQLEAQRRENADLVFSYRVVARIEEPAGTTLLRVFPSLRSAEAFVVGKQPGALASTDGAATAASSSSSVSGATAFAITVQRVCIPSSGAGSAVNAASNNSNNTPVMLRLQSRGYTAVGLVPRAGAVAREGGAAATARQVSGGAYPLMSRDDVQKAGGGNGNGGSGFLRSTLLTSATIVKMSSNNLIVAPGSQGSQGGGSNSQGAMARSTSFSSTSFNDKLFLDAGGESQPLLQTQGSLGLVTPLAQGLQIQSQEPQKKARVDETEPGATAADNELPTRPAIATEPQQQSKPAVVAPAHSVVADGGKQMTKKQMEEAKALANQPKMTAFFVAKKPAAVAVAAVAAAPAAASAPAPTTNVAVTAASAMTTTITETGDDAAPVDVPQSNGVSVSTAVDAAATAKTGPAVSDVGSVSNAAPVPSGIDVDADDEDSQDKIPFATLHRKRLEEEAEDNRPLIERLPPRKLPVTADGAGKPVAAAAAAAPPAKKPATKQMTLNFASTGKKIISSNTAGLPSSTAASNKPAAAMEDFVEAGFFENPVNDEIVFDEDDGGDDAAAGSNNDQPRGPTNPMAHMMAKARADAAAASTTTTATSDTAHHNSKPAVIKPSNSALGAAGSTPSVTHFFTGAAGEFQRQFQRRVKEVFERKPNGEITTRDIVVYINKATGEELSKEAYERRHHALVEKSVVEYAAGRQKEEEEARAAAAAAAAAKKKGGDKKKGGAQQEDDGAAAAAAAGGEDDDEDGEWEYYDEEGEEAEQPTVDAAPKKPLQQQQQQKENAAPAAKAGAAAAAAGKKKAQTGGAVAGGKKPGGKSKAAAAAAGTPSIASFFAKK